MVGVRTYFFQGDRHLRVTEPGEFLKPLSKNYRTCHKPEVGFISFSNRFENLPKSGGHGNGIASSDKSCVITGRLL